MIGLLWVFQGMWGLMRDWGRVKMFGPLKIEFPTDANLPNKMAEPYKRYSCIYAAEDRAVNVYRAALAIGVINRSRATIDDVRVQIVYGGIPMQPMNVFLPLSDPISQPSIDPSGRLLFNLGEYYFTEMHPTPPLVARPVEIVQKILEASEYIALVIPTNGLQHSGLIKNSNQLLYVKVTARNTPPLYATFRIDVEGQHTMLRLVKTSYTEWKSIQDRAEPLSDSQLLLSTGQRTQP